MKINKNIYNAFPAFTKSFNNRIIENFILLVNNYVAKTDRETEELLFLIERDTTETGLNRFFERNYFSIDDGSWLGRLIQPGKFNLNDRMWWFASGWIRCRNQILNGNGGLFVYNQQTQKCFVGLIQPHENTILRMKKYFKSIDIHLNDEELKAFHDDLVNHYLKNQNVIIKDDL